LHLNSSNIMQQHVFYGHFWSIECILYWLKVLIFFHIKCSACSLSSASSHIICIRNTMSAVIRQISVFVRDSLCKTLQITLSTTRWHFYTITECLEWVFGNFLSVNLGYLCGSVGLTVNTFTLYVKYWCSYQWRQVVLWPVSFLYSIQYQSIILVCYQKKCTCAVLAGI